MKPKIAHKHRHTQPQPNNQTSQECETELTQKGETVTRLQIKASQIGKILSNLEKKGAMDPMTDSQMSAISSLTRDNPAGPPSKKAHLRVGTIPPFNANKLRKSPSVGASAAKPADEASPKTAPVEVTAAVPPTETSKDPEPVTTPVQEPPQAE